MVKISATIITQLYNHNEMLFYFQVPGLKFRQRKNHTTAEVSKKFKFTM